MDKLKAIRYFLAAAETGSLAGAARRLEVSVPAVQKLVGALERELGLTLLERGTRGVRLTASGSEYLDQCRSLVQELEALGQVERRLGGAVERVGGTLVAAANPQLAHHVLLPSLPRFHARYPDIEIDFRTVNRIGDADAAAADVLLLHGWPEVPPDYVHRQLGGARSQIMAAPAYWAAHGVPEHPSELGQHNCLLLRNPAGLLLDLWEFERDGTRLEVPVHGWLSSNSRESVLDLVIGGHGVGRFTELTTRQHLQSGRLVPVLRDWDVLGGPPVNLLFKGRARRMPQVRAFIEHALQCLRELEAEGDALAARIPMDRPAWHQRGYGRASAAARTRR